MTLLSQVIISAEIENTIYTLEKLRDQESIVEIISPSIALNMIDNQESEPCESYIHRMVTEKEIFSVDDAKLAIEKAYIASEETTVIILAAKSFSSIVQNKLLKVLEEPPSKKVFILISHNKATILSTIRSRLPIVMLSGQRNQEVLELNLAQLSLATVYAFAQTHKRTDGKAMKRLVEHIGKEAIASQNFDLDEKTLSLFSNAFIALDVGSPPTFVLNALLLKLLARKKR